MQLKSRTGSWYSGKRPIWLLLAIIPNLLFVGVMNSRETSNLSSCPLPTAVCSGNGRALLDATRSAADDRSIVKEFQHPVFLKNDNDMESQAADDGRLHVAILLNGMPRSFTDQLIYNSIKRHLIDAMVKTDNVEYHVFINFVVDDVPRDYGAKFSTRLSPPAKLADLEPAFDALGNIRMVRLSAANSPALNDFIHVKCQGDVRPAPNYSRSWIQHVRSWETFQMMRAYEIERGIRMDWVMRTRPDLYWPTDVPPVKSLDPKTMYVSARLKMVSDHYLLIPRKMAFDVFELGVTDRVCLEGSPEQVLHRHLDMTGHVQEWVDWFYVIVRYHEGAECWRLHNYRRRWCEYVFKSWTSKTVPPWLEQ